MKKLTKTDVVVSIIALILVVALATVLGALQVSNVIDLKVSPFLLIMTVLTLGIGLYLTVYSIIKRAGYEYAVGGILALIGVILFMVCLKADAWLIVIIAVGLALIAVLSAFLLKANSLIVERTNESKDFVPYMQKLEEQKEQESKEEEPLPEIKSFKD
jgi:EamA domain-containing membrane protein RarD